MESVLSPEAFQEMILISDGSPFIIRGRGRETDI